jgi:hypothetical protein
MAQKSSAISPHGTCSSASAHRLAVVVGAVEWNVLRTTASKTSRAVAAQSCSSPAGAPLDLLREEAQKKIPLYGLMAPKV